MTLVSPIGCAQRLVFGDCHRRNARGSVECRGYAFEDVASEIFACWYEFAVGELGHFDVDVAMIEPLSHLSIENAVEYGEVNDESSERIDLAFNSYLARIRMTVKA